MAVIAMVSNIILNLILMGPLKHAGLALATSLSAIINLGGLVYYLRKRMGPIQGRRILKSFLRNFSICVVMGFAVYSIITQIDFLTDPSISMRLLVLSEAVFGGTAIYFFLSYITRSEELKFLYEAFRKKSALNQ